MQTGNTDFIYKMNLIKLVLSMIWLMENQKIKRAQSNKVLKDKVFKIVSNPKYDGYQRGLASMVYPIFDKKSKESGINEPNYQFGNELHKPIIRKFKNRKVYSSYRNNIWVLI